MKPDLSRYEQSLLRRATRIRSSLRLSMIGFLIFALVAVGHLAEWFTVTASGASMHVSCYLALICACGHFLYWAQVQHLKRLEPEWIAMGKDSPHHTR